MELARLGRYDLVKRIARGGMADVYLGVAGADTVAVKVLDPARAADPAAPALFGAEAQLGALLSHPAVPAVYEAASEHGVHYIAMEYVDGVDLGELLAANQPLPLPAALSIVAAAAAGLDHAHRRCGADGRPLRLVHRDVSPSNIMVTRAGAVKVIDFGIAQTEATTRDGLVRGKPSYMSPEQCLGQPIDLRADVFALGIVLYELTTGRHCFVGERDADRMIAIVRGDYAPPGELPADLQRVIATVLARDPAERYPSAAALIHALEAVARAHGFTLGRAAIAAAMHVLADVEIARCIQSTLVTEAITRRDIR
ncbi:MAG TPA: serine/threonine-protein kinase [Kofleriaceae bacterium]|jgi:serine/threonine-protein kinase